MLEIKLIVCPIDFSGFSVRAYRHALSLAEHYRAKLVALHVVELWRHPSVGFTANAGLYDQFCQALCEGGKEQLQEFVKQNPHDKIHPEPVYHGEHGLRTLKELGRSYLTLTKDVSRVMTRIKALYRSWAIPCSGATVYAPRHRAEWLAKISEPGVRLRAERFYQQLDLLEPVRQEARRDLL